MVGDVTVRGGGPDGEHGANGATVGRYRMMAGQEAEDVGKYMVLWAKTPDGWRIYRDMWTSDRVSE